MPEQIFTELQIQFEPEKIIFTEAELSLLPFSINSKDETENNGAINIRIELKVAKVFHKVLNFLTQESNLFQKDDYELLGEMLNKILFGKEGDARNNTIRRLLRDKKPCILFIDINNNNELAPLPWEYTLFKIIDSKAKTQKPIYLSSDLDYNFYMLRRFKKNKNAENIPGVLNVIIVEAAGGNQDTSPRIDSRINQYGEVLNVFKNLKGQYPDTFFYREIQSADFKTLREKIQEKIIELKEERKNDNDQYVIHYFGHSILENQIGKLVLFEDGKPRWKEDKEFASVFNKKPLPEMIVFQSCDSAKMGSHENQLRGVAYAMVEKDIPAIVGMQNEVNVSLSSSFFTRFYESLLKGNNVAVAITTGRDFLGKGDDDQMELYKDNSFGSPVLFITTKNPVSFIEHDSNKRKERGSSDFTICKNCGSPNYVTDKTCRVCKRDLEEVSVSASSKRAVDISGSSSGSFSASSAEKDNCLRNSIPDKQIASLNNDQSSRE